MSFRIALLGISHESNTFVSRPTVISDFNNGHYLKGGEIRKEYENAHHEIGGMIEVLDKEKIEIFPVMYAETTPGGIISEETFHALLSDMMEELEKILPVDGCLVVPHGAGVSERYRDMDGYWLSILREKLGENIPIVGTLDPHANVSHLMIASTDALIAYKTNPHIDQRQTGRDAASIIVKMLQRKIRPVQVLAQVPLAISIEQQHTDSEPCKSLYAYAKELSEYKDVLSVSIFLGFPYADVFEMGSSVIVVSDNNQDIALDIARKLESYIIYHKESFVGTQENISSALASVALSDKPVLMLDMGDNIGGGSDGNSTYLLEALEDNGNFKSFFCLYDPLSVLQASKFQKGDSFTIYTRNNKNETKCFNVTLLQLADGRFTEKTPRHGGQVNFNMGSIAIVMTAKGNVIMFASLRVSPFSLNQLTTFNIVPTDFDIIVAKGVNAPIAAYSPVCPTIKRVNTPGVTQADMTKFDYKNRRKPLYPFETNITYEFIDR